MIRQATMPERTIITGTSRWACFISSAAPLESSKPTNRNCSRPITARKPVTLGFTEDRVTVPAGLP